MHLFKGSQVGGKLYPCPKAVCLHQKIGTDFPVKLFCKLFWLISSVK